MEIINIYSCLNLLLCQNDLKDLIFDIIYIRVHINTDLCIHYAERYVVFELLVLRVILIDRFVQDLLGWMLFGLLEDLG